MYKRQACRFDARAWARAAKDAGMKYMVLTTRHHDGFCLFDSRNSSFNAMNSAAHRDFVKEYVEACREEGLKVGFYYSPLDWRFPGYFFPDLYWENALELKKQCHDQLMELMTNYGKIDLLWFDGEWLASVSYTHLRAHETRHDLVCRLLLEKKKIQKNKKKQKKKYSARTRHSPRLLLTRMHIASLSQNIIH